MQAKATRRSWWRRILGRLALVLLGLLAGILLAEVVVAPERMDLVSALVRETARTARAAGARFLLVLIPRVEEATGRAAPAALEALEGRARQAGVATLPLLPALAGCAACHFPQDQHWNAAGHRAAAEAILPRVRELLASPGSEAP